MKKTFNIIVIGFYCLYGCNPKKNYSLRESNNHNLQQLTISSDSNTTLLEFYEDGKLKSITTYNVSGHKNEESLIFHENGRLNQKIQFNNDLVTGNAYYFYKQTGALKNDRYFRNGKQVFYGADYWGDSMGTMKASLHFNDNGDVILKKNYDIYGHFVNEEKPN